MTGDYFGNPIEDDAANTRTGIIDGGAFALDEPAHIQAVWGSGNAILWAEGEPTLIYGPDGVGKTTVGQQLTLRRVGIGGGSLFDQPVTVTRSKVLYLAMDRPKQAARSFARMVTEDHRGTLEKRLAVWRGSLPIDITRDPASLARMAAEHDADTVVIDSLKDVAPRLSDEDTGSSIHHAFQACVERGIEVLALHHPRKAQADNRKPKTLADVYGSRWITAGMGSVLLLWGDAGDPIVQLEHLKQPADIVGPFELLHDSHAGRTIVVDSKDVVSIVRAAAKPMTARQVAAAMFGVTEPSRSQKEQARRRLHSAVEHRDLDEQRTTLDGGEGTLYAAA
jgi:replicative DNA helicase